MKHADEFRDPALVRALLARITPLADRLAGRLQRPLQVMEVCGGHTHTIFRHGLQDLLPPSLEFVHGPGCPVCVLPRGRVDDCLTIAGQPGVMLASYGDALRVPGSRLSLLQAKAEGADVRTVYSPLDALALAQRHPQREVVFFGLGFETTMPASALTVLQAQALGVANFLLFCNHATTAPTLEALLHTPDLCVDGFLGPGHVAMVTGMRPFEFIATRWRRPLVVTGFEPLDILQALWLLLRQLDDGRCEVENQYRRVVARDGNPAALAAIARVFEPRERFEWRGLGMVEGSGVRMRAEFAAFDAELRYALAERSVADAHEGRCAQVLTGVVKPDACPAFGRACTPATPLGALMVSSEGACAAQHQYARIRVHPPRAA